MKLIILVLIGITSTRTFADFKDALEAFDIEDTGTTLGGGMSGNEKPRVVTKRFVLKSFPYSTENLNFKKCENKLINYLSESASPIPTIPLLNVKTPFSKRRETIFSDMKKIYTVTSFFQEQKFSISDVPQEVFEKMIRSMARLHLGSAKWIKEPDAETCLSYLKKNSALSFVIQTIQDGNNFKYPQLSNKTYLFLVDQIVKTLPVFDLPRVIVHGDLHPKNFVVSDNQPYMIDFDTMQLNSRLYDFFGGLIQYWTEDGKINFKNIYRAETEYEKHINLTPIEKSMFINMLRLKIIYVILSVAQGQLENQDTILTVKNNLNFLHEINEYFKLIQLKKLGELSELNHYGYEQVAFYGSVRQMGIFVDRLIKEKKLVFVDPIDGKNMLSEMLPRHVRNSGIEEPEYGKMMSDFTALEKELSSVPWLKKEICD